MHSKLTSRFMATVFPSFSQGSGTHKKTFRNFSYAYSIRTTRVLQTFLKLLSNSDLLYVCYVHSVWKWPKMSRFVTLRATYVYFQNRSIKMRHFYWFSNTVTLQYSRIEKPQSMAFVFIVSFYFNCVISISRTAIVGH